ncbi:MAG TPA: hypothetical protein VLJ68_12880 [Chitinophagaceae bacterium]|nr:hypothetical protein [Chitinophagaceae bacterium]
MKRAACLVVSLCLSLAYAFSQMLFLNFDIKSPPQVYAISTLMKTVDQRGDRFKKDHDGFVITLSINAKQLGPEAFEIKASWNKILVIGGDDRGVLYGTLAIAEDIRNGIEFEDIRSRKEKPFLPFRAIKFDLPWDTYRHSTALSLHDQTCRDTAFWRAFLDMMAQNRFNSLSLWNLHPYTFLIKPKNFPEASPWNDAQMKEWQELFHFIFRLAKARGIDTYIIPFNIFVTPEFAKAHNVAMDNLQHNFYVPGDTSAIIKQYTRECVTQMLDEYPDLTGMGLTLGEGMGGMTPQQREDWMRETIIAGMRLANRKSKLIHRIPFSSSTSSLDVTSIETEKMTRKEIEEGSGMGFTEGPIWADLKFNWSHAHSTTKLIKVHGGKLYDTYFKPEPRNYKITWTARNEDFFCLRWGVPSFVREHIIQNTHSWSGGYFVGSETYIPAKDYFTKDTAGINWKYAFERQWLFYKIWGRLLYDPQTPDDIFKKEFVRRFGVKGNNLLEASSLAGKTPLRLASDFDLGWDFTLYSEGMLALDAKTKRVGYITVKKLIDQPPLDTDYVSIKEYVDSLVAGKGFDKRRITPPMLADMLEKDCNRAVELVENINPEKNKPLAYEIADILVWANLGLHLAEKIRGAVDLQTYWIKKTPELKRSGIIHFQNARDHWKIVVSITKPLYNEMPLVHYSEQDGKPWQENDKLRFHWSLILPEIESELEMLKLEN